MQPDLSRQPLVTEMCSFWSKKKISIWSSNIVSCNLLCISIINLRYIWGISRKPKNKTIVPFNWHPWTDKYLHWKVLLWCGWIITFYAHSSCFKNIPNVRMTSESLETSNVESLPWVKDVCKRDIREGSFDMAGLEAAAGLKTAVSRGVSF